VPLLLNMERDLQKYQRRAMVQQYKYVKELEAEYPALMGYIADMIILKLPDMPLTRDSIRSDDPALEIVARVLLPWYEVVADKVREDERDTFVRIREMTMRATEELYEVQYKTVPDAEVPVALSPDTASVPSLKTDSMVKEQVEGVPQIVFVLGEGGISAEFERYLNQMFDAKIDARNAIRTVGEKEVARIKSRFIAGVRRGESARLMRSVIVRDLLVDVRGLASNKVMATNVQRIMRTVHQRAALASVFSYARRNPYVTALVRHVGPRPCIACRALDGKIYKTYQEFRDHPNGMCSVVPRVMSIEEMRARRGINITPAIQRKWQKETGYVKNSRYKYLEASMDRQRCMVGNDALYNLWKKEDFPIEKFAVYQDKWGYFQKAAFAELALKLSLLGGRSYPKSKFVNDSVRKTLLVKMDAKDRANGSITVSLKGRRVKITDDLIDKRTPSIKEEIQRLRAGYKESIEALPYFVYNDIARVLGLKVRKARDKTFYYVV